MIKLAIAATAALIILSLLVAWSCCIVAGRADDELERMHRDRKDP
jgi:hypothetical protein